MLLLAESPAIRSVHVSRKALVTQASAGHELERHKPKQGASAWVRGCMAGDVAGMSQWQKIQRRGILLL